LQPGLFGTVFVQAFARRVDSDIPPACLPRADRQFGFDPAEDEGSARLPANPTYGSAYDHRAAEHQRAEAAEKNRWTAQSCRFHSIANCAGSCGRCVLGMVAGNALLVTS
jgi:hypothetical protein